VIIAVSLPTLPARERPGLRRETERQSKGQRLFAEFLSSVRDVGARRFTWGLVNAALPPFTMRIVRTAMLRWVGADLSERVGVVGAVTLLGMRGCQRRLHVGSGTIISHGAVFGLDARITLGENVSVGPYAVLHTGTHALGPASCRMSRKTVAKPITVENGVWIGMGAMILPGVRLGRGCVVSAGAVVKDDVAPNTLVAGNPAVVVSELPGGER
jgi:acetyltransferase-like isoleucine patch superfamily enzyme